ncbi:AAA family ATPase [Simiduia sp. 21SJ11W-1]|uniref:AAA family ATPase n=1 Tax=Simiduia sp. 21SJ11W-1 TaxID=2909669 RepID=UPI0020A0BD1F|nr:AAA family ATPase [Simiduia sp. 21SJ11W-1]UTA48622.1 AAA family ATPase [Simiduia sp. 21SJ11W-1]
MVTDIRDLGLLLHSKTPLLVLETFDELRALETVQRAVAEASTSERGRLRSRPIYRWTITDGLVRLGFGGELSLAGESMPHQEPDEVLQHLKTVEKPAVIVLCDFHPYLEGNPKNVRLLKDIALGQGGNGHTLVMVSHQLKLPKELSRLAARVNLALPSDEEIMTIVREEAKAWAAKGGRVRADQATVARMVNNLRGLSFADVRALVRSAIVDDGAITESDLPAINKAKFELLNLEGVVSFEFDTASFADVGGLEKLKQWLASRQTAFTDAALADKPKGLMLLGVQGSGKSLAAKAVAGLWGLPLLRLDFGALYNKYHGESERNLREALALADRMAPCVLWMDEVEKGLATDGNDSGTSKRLLGTLLTWQAERKTSVFVVATANDISALPPELMRKGRLDEIFFVDLPKAPVREQIFAIHLRRRGLERLTIQAPILASAAEGFSGAEIEQAVVSAIYSARANNAECGVKDILHELANTNPLSVIMAEKVAELRGWAQERCVLAD